MGLTMKNLIFFWGGGVNEKPILRGNCLKRRGGGLGQFADLRRGAWQERGGQCFWGQVNTPMHTMAILPVANVVVLIFPWIPSFYRSTSTDSRKYRSNMHTLIVIWFSNMEPLIDVCLTIIWNSILTFQFFVSS